MQEKERLKLIILDAREREIRISHSRSKKNKVVHNLFHNINHTCNANCTGANT